MQWRQMTPPPRSRPQEHAGHMRGRSNQYAGKGRTPQGPTPRAEATMAATPAKEEKDGG